MAFDFCNPQVSVSPCPFYGPTILHIHFKICPRSQLWEMEIEPRVSVLSCIPKHTHLRHGLTKLPKLGSDL